MDSISTKTISSMQCFTKICLIYGGRSPEHDVSIETAIGLFELFQSFGFETCLWYINKRGNWCFADSFEKIKGNTDNKPFDVLNSLMISRDWINSCYLYVPCIHGNDGEDGAIQGFLEILGLQYLGPSIEFCTNTINKSMAKSLLFQSDIEILPYLNINNKLNFCYEEICNRLNSSHLIIKPNKLGSSIGIEIVKNGKDFYDKIEKCFYFDNNLIIEPFIDAKDLCVGVMKIGNKIHITDVSEINCDGFYSKYLKYTDLEKPYIIPANINRRNTEKIQIWSERIFERLSGRDFARKDFLFSKEDEKIYFNEVNSIPYMGKNSLFLELFARKKGGIHKYFPDLIMSKM